MPSSAVSRFLLLLLLFVGGPLLPAAAQSQGETVVDEIVAVVGGDIILRSDVDGFVLNFLQQQGPEATYDEALWLDALQELINQNVLAEVARRDTTIIVTDDQLDQQLDQRMQQIIRQAGSEQRVEQVYGQSLAEIKAELRGDFRKQLLAQQLQQRKMANIRITPSEVATWFAQFPTDSLPTLPEIVRVSHVVRYPDVTEAAKQEATEILTVIRDSLLTGNTTFEEMARQFSDDPGSASSGGRYEGMRLGEMVPEFAAMASRLPIGEISRTFKTPFGFHIMRVNSRLGDVVDFHHVLIEVDARNFDPTSAVAFLDQVRDSVLTHDRPFELMARRHSEETSSAAMGGRVIDPRSGERDLFVEALGPSWQATLDTLDVGEVSAPAQVELLNGRTAFHIVHLQRRVPSHRWNYETDYERIKQFALQEKRAKELDAWLQTLRDDVFIDLRGRAQALTLARQ